ncbi:MAG: hypothetical protein GY804_01060 [Alphaproteobacteria bacterium]|nr:hypothetical protein [Alphaproteobacteria bacterium]
MKIYNSVLIDKNDKVIKEDSFEYEGLLAQCSSGGGQTSTSDMPSYIKNMHSIFLGNPADYAGSAGNYTRPTYSIVDAYNFAVTQNPYTDRSAKYFSPFDTPVASSLSPTISETSPLGYIQAASALFAGVVDDLDYTLDWKANVTTVIDNLVNSSLFPSAINLYNEVAATLTDVTSRAVNRAVAMKSSTHTSAKSHLDSILDQAVYEMKKVLDNAGTSALAAAQAAIADSLVTDAITAYDTAQVGTHLRAVGRFAGGMADMNAVLGNSAFIIGLALEEQSHQDAVNKFSADLKLTMFQDTYKSYLNNLMDLIGKNLSGYTSIMNSHMDAIKTAFAGYMDVWGGAYLANKKGRDLASIQSLDLLAKMQSNQLLGDQAKAEVETKANSMWIIAGKEFAEARYATLEADAKWDLDCYQYIANVLGSAGGATAATKMPGVSGAQSALSAALSGTGILGALAGYFSK